MFKKIDICGAFDEFTTAHGEPGSADIFGGFLIVIGCAAMWLMVVLLDFAYYVDYLAEAINHTIYAILCALAVIAIGMTRFMRRRARFNQMTLFQLVTTSMGKPGERDRDTSMMFRFGIFVLAVEAVIFLGMILAEVFQLWEISNSLPIFLYFEIFGLFLICLAYERDFRRG